MPQARAVSIEFLCVLCAGPLPRGAGPQPLTGYPRLEGGAPGTRPRPRGCAGASAPCEEADGRRSGSAPGLCSARPAHARPVERVASRPSGSRGFTGTLEIGPGRPLPLKTVFQNDFGCFGSFAFRHRLSHQSARFCGRHLRVPVGPHWVRVPLGRASSRSAQGSPPASPTAPISPTPPPPRLCRHVPGVSRARVSHSLGRCCPEVSQMLL